MSKFLGPLYSEFRSRLVAGQAELLLFETLLTLLREQHLLKARGKQRTDSTHVLAAICKIRDEKGSYAFLMIWPSRTVKHPKPEEIKVGSTIALPVMATWCIRS